MATDNSYPVTNPPVKKFLSPEEKARIVKARLDANSDPEKFVWVEIPSTDIFDQPHPGVSINFEHYGPERDDNGMLTGNPGKYLVGPETAVEIKRLLKNRMDHDIRVLQPKRDQVAIDIMNRNGVGGQNRG